MQQTDLAGKRLELLREIVPGLGRLGILIHVRNPGAVLDRGQVRAAAEMFGLEVQQAKSNERRRSRRPLRREEGGGGREGVGWGRREEESGGEEGR